MIKNEFQAVIFDLDGTLLNTLTDVAEAFNHTLRIHSYPEHAEEKYKYFVGNGAKECIRQILPADQRNEEKILLCLKEFREYYRQNYFNHTRPYSHIIKLLEILEKNKIKRIVFSNKPHEETVLSIQKYFPDIYFQIVLGQKESLPRKPAPDGALFIAKEIAIDPSRITFLGDTSTDMMTASSAGMYPVGALWGYRLKEELIEHGAKTLIKDPLELLDLLC